MEALRSKKEHDGALSARNGGLSVVYFWAEWSEECKQMDTFLQMFAKKYKDIACFSVEAEAVEEVANLYPIDSVPSCVFIKGNNLKPVHVVVGANPPAVIAAAKKFNVKIPTTSNTEKKKEEKDLNTRLATLVSAAPVMLFMKGSPENAKCKWSKKMVGMLKEEKVVYSYFDILTDNTVRQGLKTFSNWKTFPQLYIEGKLVGGVDVVAAHIEEEEFQDMLPKASTKVGLEERLKSLINSSKIMLFMKGDPGKPQCGFSNKIVQILNETAVKYSTFDILTDMEVRQGLKKYSNWPTYPQLYVNGKLVGGLDVVTELKEEDELMDTLAG
mmetsp:Transcript_16214/g.24452  ORF Transcript_16214/g.24452 Transcript_16214/m.24452 type:complete len:328 (+) Transcript_16214:26-1009(+)